jgi:hypothetical protein
MTLQLQGILLQLPHNSVGTKTYYAQPANEVYSSLISTAVVCTINSCSIDVIRTGYKSNYATLGEIITNPIEVKKLVM